MTDEVTFYISQIVFNYVQPSMEKSSEFGPVNHFVN